MKRIHQRTIYLMEVSLGFGGLADKVVVGVYRSLPTMLK
jgi:hypothetical protein